MAHAFNSHAWPYLFIGTNCSVYLLNFFVSNICFVSSVLKYHGQIALHVILYLASSAAIPLVKLTTHHFAAW